MTYGPEQLEAAPPPRLPVQRTRLLDAIRLVSRSTFWAVVIGGTPVVISAAFPIFLFLSVPLALGLVIAVWTAAMGAGAGSLVSRSPNARPVGVVVGALLAVGAVALLGPLVAPGSWNAGADLAGRVVAAGVWGGSGILVVVIVASTNARMQLGPRGVVARGLLASAVAAGSIAAAAAVTAWAQRPWFDPDDTCPGDGRYDVRPFPVRVTCTGGGAEVPLTPGSLEALQLGGVAVAVILLVGAVVVATASRPAAQVAAITSAGLAALLSVVVVVGALLTPFDDPTSLPGYLGTSGRGLDQPMLEPPAVEVTDAATQPAEPEPSAEAAPTLDVGRAQFALLAEAALTAAGEGAIWRDAPPLEVREEPCADGVRLVIDGEFATGVITDTTSDEHDREVTAGNVAAADRIASAWHAAGLGAPERLHDEPHLGPGSLGSVESARVSFDFGVAQPRVEGRCLVGG